MQRGSLLVVLVLGIATVVRVPRMAAEQAPPSDVSVAEARSGDGLRLTVFAASYLRSDLTTSVLVGVEVEGLAETAVPRDGRPRQLEITCLVNDASSISVERTVAVPLASGEALRMAAREGARVLTRVALPAGRYALRVMARDTGDERTASVVHDLEVPSLTGASIAMSGLTISSSAVIGMTQAEGNEEERILPLVARPPTGRRQFSRGDRVEVDAEIYHTPAAPDGDLEEYLSITTSLVTPNGLVMSETSDSGASETLPSGAYGYRHYTLVPIAPVPPGPYVVRVTASDGMTSISRSVPITVLE